MNIAVITSSHSTFYFKPDTSLERDVNKDFYVPDFICGPTAVPVVFVKMTKPCKSAQPDFTERYYDSFSYGVLLNGQSKRGLAMSEECSATSLDYSSVLPLTMKGIGEYGKDESAFSFKCGTDNSRFRILPGLSQSSISKALVYVTKYCTLRAGDVLAVSLSEPQTIRRGFSVAGMAFGETLFDFRIR
jgi:hypothetical protein